LPFNSSMDAQKSQKEQYATTSVLFHPDTFAFSEMYDYDVVSWV